MQSFFKKILIFAIAFFIFDKIFLAFLLISPKLEVDNRLEKLIKGKINKDIIILGSSRGARNLIASQIEDSTGLSVFNLSYPGSDITFHEFLLRALLKFNNSPKFVFLAVDDPDELQPNKTITFRLDRLYPLAIYNYVNDEMIDRGEKNMISKYLVLSRINKKNFDLRKKHFSAIDTISKCGSMPIYFQRQDRNFYYDSIYQQYNPENELVDKRDAFSSIQSLCKKNNISLKLVFSPNYKLYNNGFVNRINEIKESNVELYVYDTVNLIYKDKSFYYDESHLLTKGAIIFTNEIIEKFKSDIH